MHRILCKHLFKAPFMNFEGVLESVVCRGVKLHVKLRNVRLQDLIDRYPESEFNCHWVCNYREKLKKNCLDFAKTKLTSLSSFELAEMLKLIGVICSSWIKKLLLHLFLLKKKKNL